ncbi:MAG TPA: rhamnogalacturonan acetylesterase [Candidatus Synoicihabitans sp.]|nr:rhamnogalacturonan acetylesterase [Candidatus Synoicihabitans sp.]
MESTLRPTLYLIGDSTVRNEVRGQQGWGDPFAIYFDAARLRVVNRAIGGRSSRTFLTDGRWAKILADLRPGDFVVMQFGHNDGGPINDNSRARGTIRGVGEEAETIENLLTKQTEVVRSYGWYLRKYVSDTQAKGAHPIVCSPVPRKVWQEGHLARDREAYASWARAVANSAGATFIDLNEIISRGYEALGPSAVEAFFADERTHTTPAGAAYNAAAVVAGLKALPSHPLAVFLDDTAKSIDATTHPDDVIAPATASPSSAPAL